MLGGERTNALVNEIDPAPNYQQTAHAAFEKPFLQTEQLINYIFPGSSTEETRRKTAARISYIDELQSDPRQSLGQKTSNVISGIAGGLLPTLPLALGFEAFAGAAAGVIGFGVRKIATEAASEYGSEGLLSAYTTTQVPLSTLAKGPLAKYLPGWTIGQVGTQLAKGYAGYKGVIIPEHFSNNYDEINNTLNVNEAIQDWGADNYGFLFGGAPIAAGYIAFKGIRGIINLRKSYTTKRAIEAEHERLLNQHKEILKQNEIKEGEIKAREAKVSELQEHLQRAEEENYITPEMHKWYLDYLENPNDAKVHKGGLEILQSLQIPYDRVTGRVWNQILSREDVRNLQGALFDQGITNLSQEDSQLLSNYIFNNSLDSYIGNMLQTPALFDAMKGMTYHLGLKIAEHKVALAKFDEFLARNLTKRLTKNAIFSQKNMYKHLKEIGVRNILEVPYHVPKQVRQKLKLLERIEKIKSRSTLKYRREFKDGTLARLKNELNLMKTLNPDEELVHLRDSIISNGKLAKNYAVKNSYYRLQDLAQVWPEAQHLLNRIDMEAFNAKQQALNEVVKNFIEMVDNNAARLASPDSVKRYLHARIERGVPFIKEFERGGILREADRSTVETPETLFDEAATEKVASTELEFAKDDFIASEKKYKQFSTNETALKDLINCALGE